MKITGPQLVLIAATRGMLGAGIGLLAAGRLRDEHRRLVGKILLGIGAASTIPLAMRVFRARNGARTQAGSLDVVARLGD
jgi:hypothetical protein